MDIKQQVGGLSDMIAQAIAGNYDAAEMPFGVDDDFAPLYERIREIIAAYKRCDFEMQNTASQILSATEDLSLTLEENAAFSNELFERSRSIRGINVKSHNNTLLAIQQIKDFVERIDSIRQASDKARATNTQTKVAIDSALERVQQTVGFIGEIESMTEETVQYVRAFIESTGRISDILQIVESISKQMELISFNAVIESRRAGLEGRSFGVIASAFRDLSDQSKREVQNIYEVIGSVHTESQRLEETIARNASGVQECATHAGGITGELNEIETTYREVSDVIGAIYRNVEAQSRTAQDIGQSMQDIEVNSEQANEDFEGIYRALKQQKAEMGELSKLGQYLQNASQGLSAFAEKAERQSQGTDSQHIKTAAEKVFALLNNVALGDAFLGMETVAHQRILDKLMETDVIESVWSNHASGKFVYSNPPAGIANARIRPWFKESITGRKYVSDVYISAITHQPCVTVSVPIVRGGQCIGVLGADLKLSAG